MPRMASAGLALKGKKASPDKPTLTYSADGQFTISNYNAAYNYTVSGCARSGASLTSVSNGSTITVSWASGAPQSAAATMNVAAHGRVFDSLQETLNSAGCGPRGNVSCSNGSWILDLNGATSCCAPGTQGDFCSGACPGNCYGIFNVGCYTWHWTDYSGSGYTLIGSTWGKAS